MNLPQRVRGASLGAILLVSGIAFFTGRPCRASDGHPAHDISSHAIRVFILAAIGSDISLAKLVPPEAGEARLPFLMDLRYPENPAGIFISGYNPTPYATLGPWRVMLNNKGPVHEGMYIRLSIKTFKRNGDKGAIECEDVLLYPHDSDGRWLLGRESPPTLKGWIVRTYTMTDAGKYAYGHEVHEIAAGGEFSNLAGKVRSVAVYDVIFVGRVEPGKP